MLNLGLANVVGNEKQDDWQTVAREAGLDPAKLTVDLTRRGSPPANAVACFRVRPRDGYWYVTPRAE